MEAIRTEIHCRDCAKMAIFQFPEDYEFFENIKCVFCLSDQINIHTERHTMSNGQVDGDIYKHMAEENNLSKFKIGDKAVIDVTQYEYNGQAMRANNGKAQYSMLDLGCLKPCVEVLEYGANKYARNNWKKGMPISSILDSLMRHISDLQTGKSVDDESGLSIIGHIQCNALFLANPNNTDDMSEQGE